MNSPSKPRRGRPSKYSAYDDWFQRLPASTQRPAYLNGIGVSRGVRGDSVWIKVTPIKPITHQGRYYKPGQSIEIRLGKRTSWTWEELERERVDVQRRADRGEPIEDAQSVSFKDYALSWLKNNEKLLKGITTASVHINCQFIDFFGGTDMAHITTSEINRWIARRFKDDVQPATVKRELATLSSIFSAAERERHVDTNPCLSANRITGIVPKQRYLQPEELVRVFGAAHTVDETAADLIWWFLHSGMRRAEVMAIKTTDVITGPSGRKYVQIRLSKSGKPRPIWCSPLMTDIITRQAERFPGVPTLFPMSAMTLKRRWHKIRQIAGCPDVTIHDLRRTHATYLAADGLDLKTLADRLGHADLDMLHRIYSVALGSNAENAADRVQKVFDSMVPAAQALTASRNKNEVSAANGKA